MCFGLEPRRELPVKWNLQENGARPNDTQQGCQEPRYPRGEAFVRLKCEQRETRHQLEKHHRPYDERDEARMFLLVEAKRLMTHAFEKRVVDDLNYPDETRHKERCTRV